MSRLPASPSRTQALMEFEPVLLDRFRSLTGTVNVEVRDTMHYALFSAADRFCTSSAWMIAPRIGISVEKLAPVACAIETLRCSLAFKLRSAARAGNQDRLFEPMLAEAATYGLIPLAFEMALSCDGELNEKERCGIGVALARAASPVHVLSALHRESRMVRDRTHLAMSRDELQCLYEEKVLPAYLAMGEALALLSGGNDGLANWFRKLGLFTHWMEEFSGQSHDPLALTSVVSLPEAMDLIKSLEADLLDRARELGLRDAAHEIVEPLADMLKTRLQ